MIQKLAINLFYYIWTWKTNKHWIDWTFRTKPIQMESVYLHYFLRKS